MALVCEFKSSVEDATEMCEQDRQVEQAPQSPLREEESIAEVDSLEAPQQSNDDLEDGEIEDDDEEEAVAPPLPQVEQQETNEQIAPVATVKIPAPALGVQHNKGPGNSPKHVHGRGGRFDRGDRHRYEERKRGHLTEAEKSVMRLHKLERLEREKRDRYKREQVPIVDDFASNIEKAIANVLKKDKKQSGGEEEEDEKRGKKRKRKDKERKKAKYKKGDSLSPRLEEDEGMSDRRGSINEQYQVSDYDSHESSCGSDRGKEDRMRDKRKEHEKPKMKNKDRLRMDKKGKDKRDYKTDLNRETLCTFFMQGNCNKGDECPFLHQVTTTSMKLELCKFYLMDCCAKGDKCLYMHSQFPCKFYHLGLNCKAGNYCKFAHGGPLSDAHKHILFKHIETAPKEILGEFPRLNREGALGMLGQTQKILEAEYSMDKNESSNADLHYSLIPSLFEMPHSGGYNSNMDKDKAEKITTRNRPSRWQQNSDIVDDKPKNQLQGSNLFGLPGFYGERDQDMRIMSNGDVDMRTLIPPMNAMLPNGSQGNILVSESKTIADVDIREENIENEAIGSKSSEEESRLEVATEESSDTRDSVAEMTQKNFIELPSTLPKKQRELFLRIQAQQKENLPEINTTEASDEERNNIDWYSDDDEDDNRLTIKDDLDDEKCKEEDSLVQQPDLPAPIKPVEVIEKLGDLSKIDISMEVTKLLSSISRASSTKETPTDPRIAAKSASSPIGNKPAIVINDPRRARFESTSDTESKKEERISIYEQGSLSIENSATNKDVDLRTIERDLDLRPPIYGDTDLRPAAGRLDVDLRPLALPFKAMQNYTPATEIDASINSHAPIQWRVYVVDIPQPDYAGLKLSAHEAQNTGDPRLKKLFKINMDEKDSPASPTKESPKAVVTGIRADPRRRKLEDKLQPVTDYSQMNYSQQLNILQTSAFYQSLTSNQKVLLNQELSTRSDHSGNHDTTLNGILTNLGLIPSNTNTAIPNIPNATAMNILANVNNVNPMLAQSSNMMLLGQNQPFVPNPSMNPNILNQNPAMVNQMGSNVMQGSSNMMGNAPNAPSAGMSNDFQLNFDPRQGGLLGNAPPINFVQSDNSGGFNNYSDDFYDGNFSGNNMESGGGPRGGGRGRGFRDRSQHRRGGRGFNNRNGRNFRNNRNRSNRSRTPPEMTH